MKTIRKQPIKLVFVDYIPEILEPNIFYYSQKYQISNHLCVCGCGNQVPIPIKLDEWTLTLINDKFTITPSIQQRFDCKSHYIIKDNESILLGESNKLKGGKADNDIIDNHSEIDAEMCPECNNVLIEKWSGVQCSICDYFDCY